MAAARTYQCSISDIGYMDSSGKLTRETIFQDLSETYESTPLTVNSETGLVVHPVFGNSNFDRVHVFDQGTSESNVKIFSYSPKFAPEDGDFTGVASQFVEINTWKEDGAFPFIIVEAFTILSGVCQ